MDATRELDLARIGKARAVVNLGRFAEANVPVPVDEENNPNFTGCVNHDR